MTLRDRKKEQTREAIVGAAFELFDLHGFDGTTVDQIAEAAGVSRRTFFRYFRTKEAVVFPERDARLTLFRERLGLGPPDEPPFAGVRRALLDLAAEYQTARALCRARNRVVQGSDALQAYDQELDRQWETVIAEALGRGARESLHARLAAGAVMGVVRACLAEWQRTECQIDLRELGRQAVALLERGIQNKGENGR